MLSELSHESIIKIRHVSVNGEYRKFTGSSSKVVYFVMNIADYGELYQFLEANRSWQERHARYFFRQLIEGLTLYFYLNLFIYI
jgi:serine/threonine protein kinase